MSGSFFLLFCWSCNEGSESMAKKRKYQRRHVNPIRKLSLNTIVKVKLTEKGVDIYFHQYDDLIDKGIELARMYPDIDEDGYTSFRLWSFMNLYGPYIDTDLPTVIDDICLYIPNDDMDYVNE